MTTSYSFVDKIDANSDWTITIEPGGFKYTSTSKSATMTICRTMGDDIDLVAECGGEIPVGTCVWHVGSTALVLKP